MNKAEYKKACVICFHDNHKDNFICENCGFDFDLEIVTDEFGLPTIQYK